MSDFNPVAWTEGMFLRPQHMQQQERYLQFQHASINTRINPFAWGIFNLEIDSALLSLGQFRLDNIECVFQDNTLALLPEQSPLPEAISIPPGTSDQVIYLVVPVNKSSGLNISCAEDKLITRYNYTDHHIVDTSVGSDAMEVLQVAKLNCQLKLQSEDRAGYLSIAVARISDVSEEGAIRLDKKFIPSCMVLDHMPALANLTREILGMIHQRADAIAARLSQAQGSSSSIADFLMLQLLNKYQPLFEHYASATGLHPELLYTCLLAFAGELSTFSSADKRIAKLPRYQHDNLTYIFSNLMVIINQGLSSVLEQTAIELPLEKSKFGVYLAVLNDKDLLKRAEFILAVKASLPHEEIRNRLPGQIKIGAVETIRDLVNNQLPGIGITSLPVAPRQVPYHAGYHYFQLDKSNSHWLKLASSGGIALHLSGNYPELALELWAINN
ncbi:type VI secretion system baseplate subunit TssK [Thalassomonas haliotis]|uniref:Type VI secretion system baseplate subunit TssK n=1 Tax=Thalassomonas haliotis TaxID=485448 RepID=A0ABY7VK43_9GAMM|nr:type VI secretion system baseplate subunit TssK [Thalassomonas haliotis]WDE13875.1 type VI secretion system baseplate subunit TssK [Thalassomonas haliotis]